MASHRIAIYGGNGFIGSHIAEHLSAHDLCVLCLSRTGHKPVYLRDQAWSEEVRWCVGDANEPNIKLLSSANTLVCAVGSPPLPTFSQDAFDAKIHSNGTVNVNAIRAAGEAGVKQLVLISAKIPWPLQRDSFAYTKGKRMSEAAATEFANLSPEHQALILRPGVVYGTRYTQSGRAIPLGTVMGPLAKVCGSQFNAVEQVATRVTNFITQPENYASGCTILTGQEI